MLKHKFLLFFIFFNSIFSSQQLLDKGNKLFLENKYREAIRVYSEISYDSFEKFYNIATAYYQVQDYIKAIVYWKKAEVKINDFHQLQLIDENLKSAYGKLNKRFDSSFIDSFLKVFNLIPQLYLQVFFLALWYFLLVYFFIKTLSKPSIKPAHGEPVEPYERKLRARTLRPDFAKLRRAGKLSSLSAIAWRRRKGERIQDLANEFWKKSIKSKIKWFLPMLCFSVSLLFFQNIISKSKNKVIVVIDSKIYAGPSGDIYHPVADVKVLEELQLSDSLDNWLKVKIGKYSGWISKQAVELIQ